MADSYKQSFKKGESGFLSLSIYNCGLQSCTKGYTWGPGIRDHYLIHLVTSGKGTFSAGRNTFALSAGDLFFAQPGQLITYTADSRDPWEYYWVGYNGNYAAQLATYLPFTEENPTAHLPEISAAKEYLHKTYLASGTEIHNETAMTGYLYLFLSLLMQQNVGKEAAVSSAAQYVANAVKFIQFNYSRDITVDDIAKAVGVSRSHLYRVFVSQVGKSLVDYLTDYRITQACALLENTPLSVAEVAYSVGFFDQFYFSRVFKKVKGVPPSRYLEKKKSKNLPEAEK